MKGKIRKITRHRIDRVKEIIWSAFYRPPYRLNMSYMMKINEREER